MTEPVEHVVVEADGGARGNPGPAGYGAVVRDAASGAVLAERSEAIGIATNNVAEYRGLIAGLSAAAELAARRVDVRMDSKLVVEQMSGRWQVKHESMRALAREAIALRSVFDEVTFEWIPRAQNSHADRLANEAMDRAAGIEPRPRAGAAPRAAATVASASWAPPDVGATRVILVRHGATEHSPARRFSGRNDLPLSAAGETQAAALARRAAGWPDVAAVLSSPLPRATQTADGIARAIGCPVEVEPELIEIDFGAWEGLTFAEAHRADAGVLARWATDPDAAPPGGESFAVASDRAERARAAILGRYAGRTVVAVTHVTPVKMLVRLALDAPLVAVFRLHLDTASLSIIDYREDGTPSVRLLNDTSHLAVG